MSQGILTKDTVLEYRDTGDTWVEIDLLMEVPDIGGTPDQVEVTTLKDGVRKYIPGVKDLGDLEFQFLYDNSGPTSNWRVLKGFQDSGEVKTFRVKYPDGTAHQFDAIVNVRMDAAAVNAALTFTATFFLQSEITVTDPT